MRNLFPYFVLIIVVFVVLSVLSLGRNIVNEITTGELMNEIASSHVKEITITPSKEESIYYIEGKLESYKENESFKTQVVEAELPEIIKYAENNELKVYQTKPDPGNVSWFYIVINVLPLIVVVVGSYIIFTKMANSNKGSMDFGKSRAKLSADGGKVRFSDVAGLKEEKEEVSELIDFLKNPNKFQKLGARIPKGVLLVGPPGTGKTLLAKAVAGEANVPFYFISGSDFVELFVGVGASRVRDMFKEAKRNAPCLIFIDEIDAVGRQRGSGIGGGHDEREQTLNQLLTEMDGFGANEGIIIIAATNRPDVLDPALLRPGRFDRQVTVSLPDTQEREAILKVHAKNKVLAPSVNLKSISQRTSGFSGAELENLMNEAALLAVRKNESAITLEDIDEATDRVLMGPAKVSRKVSDNVKWLTAVHESGHAVIGLKLKDAMEVQKITIVPRGMAGGYTAYTPKEDNISRYTRNEMIAMITSSLGGRASEELFLDDITTGASDDFKRATNLARSMVTEYGMSSLGPIRYEANSGENVFLGRDYNKQKNYSDQVALEIDQEARKIIMECYENAKIILKENKDLVMLLSNTLIERETITKEQIDELVRTGKIEDEEFNISDEPTLTKLRETARSLKVKGYTKMTKEELESAIEEAEKEESEQ
ncbi:MAG: ATP-dependent zinc metalloprotease FtsH [Bacilli bacterium]|nr:ATP-dependent zinc metalloprotease FtsH [Bacilli bacterium]